MTAERPNILWYCTDQQRWDTVRALGNAHIRTPVLDGLCERGVAFRRAYCQSPICTPSRASFLTGRYPASHHVHRNGNVRFPAGEVLVTRIFADAGYDCGLVGKLHLSAAKEYEVRPDDGYRVFHWSHHPGPPAPLKGHAYDDWLRHEKGIDPHALYAGRTGFCGAGVPAEYHQTTWCTEMAIRFVTERRDRPWLLSVNPFDPHPPFDPPADYLSRYDPATMPPPLFRPDDIERQEAFRSIDQQAVTAIDPTDKPAAIADEIPQDEVNHRPPGSFDGREVKAAYYAMIELIDTQLGRLTRALEASGQLDNTVIVFHGDHGELLGDHGLIYKGCRFFDGLVRVPLIVAMPGRLAQNVVSDALVELVDLAPTLLDLAGLDVPRFMQGKSLLPILSGAASPNHHKACVVSEYHDALMLPDGTHGTMVCDGRIKSVVYHGHGTGELFDLAADPGEFDNLWDEPGRRELKSEALQRHLDAIMATSGAGIERVAAY